jgi:predicted PurR-regulated permease PerM
MGVFEIVPLVGPILGAIPVLVVTLATSPSNLPWVLLLIVAAQQIVDYVLVPLVARDTVRLHPALVMLVIVVGSDVAGVWGVVLSVPMTAIVRDVARYLVLRVSETPLQPGDALGQVMARNGGG